jgi:hypothetical protein
MNRVCLSLALVTLTSFAAIVGCSDDPDVIAGAGGEGGDNGTSGSGGKASGGSNTTAGKAGGPDAGGAGGEPGNAGAGGASGEPGSEGGAAGEAASAGAPGMGGAGSDVVYQCNDTTRTHKLCSALKAAACTPATDCADCVVTRNSEREPFLECAACTAEYDAHWQCAVDAFEGGSLGSGVECLEDFGADPHFENCYPLFDSALLCLDHLLENPCPETWPIE